VKLNQLPNLISIFRFILVAPVIWSLLHGQYVTALVLFAVAGFSDALDGFLAKHFHWVSRLGSVLDPLADKLLLVSCYLTLAWLGFIPVWLVTVVILRDVLIVIGGAIFHLLFGQFEMAPSRISKLNTFFQIIFVLAVVFYHGDFLLKPWIIEALGYIVLVTTVTSGADYVWVWGHKAVQAAKQKQQHSS
jgi:cardiolipin synthase